MSPFLVFLFLISKSPNMTYFMLKRIAQMNTWTVLSSKIVVL